MKNSTPVNSRTSEMVIGKCTYIVTTHFNQNGRESVEDKLLRIVSERITADIKNAKSITE